MHTHTHMHLLSSPVTYTWAGSLDELCAEASELLGVRVDFEAVYRQNGAAVTSRAELKNQELLVLAPLGEAFVKPDPPVKIVGSPNPITGEGVRGRSRGKLFNPITGKEESGRG